MSIVQKIAAKGIIVNPEGKILILQQSHEAAVTNASRYHAPGGMVEPGEHLHEALKREVLEETGLQITVGQLLTVHEWRSNIRGQECQFFGVFYLCQTSSSDITLSEESAGYAWVSKNDVAQYDVIEPARSLIAKHFA